MDIIKILGGLKNTIIIGVCLFIAFQFYTLGGETSSFLKKQSAYLLKQQANTIALNNTLQKLADKNAELTAKLAEKAEKDYQMRMDMGKSIKAFNQKVKALKQIEDIKESVAALHKAWKTE